MKLKKVLTLLPLLATTALVASCGNNSSSSSSASKPSTSSTTPSTSSTTKPTSSSSSSSGDNGGLDLSSVVDEIKRKCSFGFSAGIFLCREIKKQRGTQKLKRTDVFYGRVWRISEKTDGLSDGICFLRG